MQGSLPETLSGLTRADEASHIECGQRMTTTHAEIVQAARNLHDQIREAVFGQTQDIFDDPTPFDPSNYVFHDHAGTGEEAIEELIPYAQCLAFRLFLGCVVRTAFGS
jgi:hypothetical protein